jgi:hypothetical protein
MTLGRGRRVEPSWSCTSAGRRVPELPGIFRRKYTELRKKDFIIIFLFKMLNASFNQVLFGCFRL